MHTMAFCRPLKSFCIEQRRSRQRRSIPIWTPNGTNSTQCAIFRCTPACTVSNPQGVNFALLQRRKYLQSLLFLQMSIIHFPCAFGNPFDINPGLAVAISDCLVVQKLPAPIHLKSEVAAPQPLSKLRLPGLLDASMSVVRHHSESPRILRRLKSLRGLSHEEVKQVFT